MDKSRKANLSREEECCLSNETESAGEILRGSGNSADKNRKPERLDKQYKHCWTGRRRRHAIISADISISDSADRVTKMFQNTPAFNGTSGAADLFQAPAENNEIPIASTVSAAGPVEFEGTPILESPEVKSRQYILVSHQRKFEREGELLMSKMIRSMLQTYFHYSKKFCFNRWLYSQHSYS